MAQLLGKKCASFPQKFHLGLISRLQWCLQSSTFWRPCHTLKRFCFFLKDPKRRVSHYLDGRCLGLESSYWEAAWQTPSECSTPDAICHCSHNCWAHCCCQDEHPKNLKLKTYFKDYVWHHQSLPATKKRIEKIWKGTGKVGMAWSNSGPPRWHVLLFGDWSRLMCPAPSILFCKQQKPSCVRLCCGASKT